MRKREVRERKWRDVLDVWGRLQNGMAAGEEGGGGSAEQELGGAGAI